MTDDPTTTARLDTTDPDRPRGDVGGLGDARVSELADVLRLVSGPIYQNGGRYSDVAAALAPLVAGWIAEERAGVLREAAADYFTLMTRTEPGGVPEWLRERADQIGGTA